MIVISDTNILSSFAAGNAFSLLFHLFAQPEIYIPPAVLEEVHVALTHGRSYLLVLVEAVATQQIVVLPLNSTEAELLRLLPHRLNVGERQAIVLAEQRNGVLLSNDQRAVRYCEQQGIRSLDLVDILRLLWVRKIISRRAVHELIEQMQRVEQLILTPEQRSIIFEPHHSR